MDFLPKFDLVYNFHHMDTKSYTSYIFIPAVNILYNYTLTLPCLSSSLYCPMYTWLFSAHWEKKLLFSIFFGRGERRIWWFDLEKSKVLKHLILCSHCPKEDQLLEFNKKLYENKIRSLSFSGCFYIEIHFLNPIFCIQAVFNLIANRVFYNPERKNLRLFKNLNHASLGGKVALIQ